MGSPTQDGRPIQLIGPLGKDKLLLQSFTGQEGISIPFHYDLVLLSLDDSIKFEDVVGKPATIRVELPDKQERFINGIFSSFTQTDKSGTEFADYQATLVPRLWMLTRNADCRIFQNQSVPDIIKVILDENQVQFNKERLTPGRYKPRPYCVQYSETDFHFISRLMEDEGIFYFFEHSVESGQGKHLMVLADDPNEFKPVPAGLSAGATADFRGGGSTGPSDEAIASWNVAEEVRPDMYELRDFNFEQPKLDLTSQSQTGQDATLEIYEFPGGYIDKDRGQKLVDVRMEEIETAKRVISGSGSYRGFISGFRFNLSGHFRKDLNDKPYVLTSIFHCFRQGNVFSTTQAADAASFRYVNTFQTIPHPTRFRPPRTTKVPIIPSTQTAIVVGPNTTKPDGTPPPPPAPHTIVDDIYTDKFGRVKVKFHWDRSTKNGDTTAWIRVAQPWAGPGWGHQWIPRVGHEVVVTFLEGDPDQPLITGSVYNGNNDLPFSTTDCKTQSGIRTHSTPFDPDSSAEKYHMLRFDDKTDKEQVFLRSQRRMDFRALTSFYETNGADRHAVIGYKDDKGQGGDFNITVGNDVNFHIQGGRYDRIEKKLNVTVVGNVVHDFEADRATLVTGKDELNAQQIIIEAKQKISLKVGGSFILIEPAGVTIYGPLVKINSGGFGVETGDPEIEDPLDATPADTGKPCNRLYTASGGGAKARRRKRTLHSEHAPSVPRAGESANMRAIRNTLQNSAAGRHALEVYDRYGVNSTFNPGQGGGYTLDTNTMNLDPNWGDYNNSAFVHEMNHAERDHEPNAPTPQNRNRADYVDQMLQDEAHGDAVANQSNDQLAANGQPQTNAAPSSATYHRGYNQGAADYSAAHPDATPEQVDDAGKAAGEKAVLDDYRAGRVTTSLPPPNNQPYPNYYGGIWDAAHPAPAGGGGAGP